MKDRVSANPGRVLITPENGDTAFYATMTRADNPSQEGDPINKTTLLKDATAALFGFSAEQIPDTVPDDVLGKIKTLLDQVQTEASGKVRVEIVSRVGTGATNITNGVQCNLTFDEVPDMVVALYSITNSTGYINRAFFGGLWGQASGNFIMYPKVLRLNDYSGGNGLGFSYNSESGGMASNNRKTINWKNVSSVADQFLNGSGITYWFAAFYF